MPEHEDTPQIEENVTQYDNEHVRSGLLEATDSNEETVEEAPVEASKPEVPDEVMEVLKAHEGDPDWSVEEYLQTKGAGVKFNPKGTKSPGEFNRAGQYINAIKDLKSRITKQERQFQKQLSELKSQMTSKEVRDYKKEADQLEAYRLQAVEMGDTEQFKAIDQQYAELRGRLSQIEPQYNEDVQSQKTALTEEVQDFYDRNSSWVRGGTPEAELILDEAHAFEQRLLKRRAEIGQPLTETELVHSIEHFVRTKFPDKFRSQQQKTRVQAVEGVESPKLKTEETKIGYKNLTEFQKGACARFMEDNPGSTVDEFVQLMQLPTSGVDVRTLMKNKGAN